MIGHMQFELAEHIQQILEIEAQRRGVTVQELVRWLLGEWAIGITRLGDYPMPICTPSGGEVASPADPVDVMVRVFQMGMAGAGALNCQNCTQRLTTSDVKKGACSKCGALIE